jgi:hypothetical protein
MEEFCSRTIGGFSPILLHEPVGTDQAIKRCLRQHEQKISHVCQNGRLHTKIFIETLELRNETIMKKIQEMVMSELSSEKSEKPNLRCLALRRKHLKGKHLP